MGLQSRRAFTDNGLSFRFWTGIGDWVNSVDGLQWDMFLALSCMGKGEGKGRERNQDVRVQRARS